MGNFEKLVVMTILFLTMLVLAVTFHKGDPKDAGSPMDVVALGSSDVLAAPAASEASDAGRAPLSATGAPAGSSPSTGSERVERLASGSAPGGLLSASLRETERTVPVGARPLVSAQDGRVPIIRDWTGLELGKVDDYCYYTVDAGESFESIAGRIYGDAERAELLRFGNEGLAAPVAGKRLFVPVFDHRPARRAPAMPVRGSALASREAAVPATKPATSTVTKYVVQGGDTLSEISMAVYGTSRRYAEIFEANRDQLASPDVLGEGMVLRIPR